MSDLRDWLRRLMKTIAVKDAPIVPSGITVPGVASRTWINSAGHTAIISALVIVTVQGLIGCYATYLNHLFYSKFGPFFDSLSYLNSLARMSAVAKSDGVLRSLSDQISASTVFYPWLLFAPFAKFAPLDRSIGVWIQIFTALCMQFALFYYFWRFRQYRALYALVASSVFMGLAAQYRFDGGIADFRMDLLQFFLFATVMALYMICRETAKPLPWLMLGASAGILCLGRATSPVYLVVLVALLAPVDLLNTRAKRWHILLCWAVAALTAAIVAGWFYVINFKYLWHYYFIWNNAANAALPLSQSSTHISLVLDDFGPWLLWPLIGLATVRIGNAILHDGVEALVGLNWRALLFSIVPLGYLVLSGAGLNSFVSMVSCAGLLLFFLDPVAGPKARTLGRMDWALAICVCAGVAFNVYDGVANHTSDDRDWSGIPRRSGIEQITRAILSDIDRRGAGSYLYSEAHVGSFPTVAITNVLVFDEGYKLGGDPGLIYHDATIGEDDVGGASNLVEWNEMEGATDEEKISMLVARINYDDDFFVMASESTELDPDEHYINRFIPEINRQILLSGLWEPLTPKIAVTATEQLIVLHKSDAGTHNAASLPRVSAGQPLDFANGQNRDALLSGWSAAEPEGVWSDGYAAFVGFVVERTDAPKQAIVRAMPALVPGKLSEQRVQVWSDGKKLGEFVLQDANAEFAVPLSNLRTAPVILGFYLPDAKAPEVVDTNKPDTRTLGLYLKSLQLTP